MNHFPLGPAKIIELFGDKEGEIKEAVQRASDAHNKLDKLLGISEFNAKYPSLNPGNDPLEVGQRGANLQYVFDMFRVYITSNQSERSDKMRSFADDYQKPFSEVERVLSYLGLRI
ncbi:hypothetical protein HYT23_01810 [Candidatus Pacearchaeota archaeon]|nr:hypothetical protein [Candidatus Pacearchaeota archaeon]